MPPDARRGLLRYAQRSDLHADTSLYEPGIPAGKVYFPVTAVCSLMTVLSTGERVETATVGNEGLVGIPGILGTVPRSLAIVQMSGEAVEIPIIQLRECFERLKPVRSSLLAFISYGFDMTRQSVACNAYHSIDQRLARWLLIVNDRAKSDRISLSQDYLSSMVAASRPRVSQALARLRKKSIVEQGRGWIEVVDRHRLERCSCECYGVLAGWRQQVN